MHVHSSFSTAAKDAFMLRRMVRGEREVFNSSSFADKGQQDHLLETAAGKGLQAVVVTENRSVEGMGWY